jgi:two-component system chemotaxis response regulator CheB
VIVVGASVGGVEAVREIVRELPSDFPASLFVVVHTAPSGPGHLPGILARSGHLPAAYPQDGDPIEPGRIYVAPPDHHLLIEPGRVRLTHGPKENRFRPAVDPLFRSAALVYGPRVIGVVLTGGLDDGTAGLWAVKTCGGIAVVQDPDDAVAPSMPNSALRHNRVDHCCRLQEMPRLLARLVKEPAESWIRPPLTHDLAIETRIAMQDPPREAGVFELGEPSMLTCPECHGALLRLKRGVGLRFRCHTGHAYTAKALLSELKESTEAVLWNAARAVQETSLLMTHIAAHLSVEGDAALAANYERDSDEARRRFELLCDMAMSQQPGDDSMIDGAPRNG